MPPHQPIVVNRPVTRAARLALSRRSAQMIAVALAEGENVFGWLAAFNHVDDGEFGTVEASLLSSVAAILGIHSGNIELYRQQSELLAGIVRALTSAIDAKDPYTCGHSDRVARVAVRLAEELGCDAKTLNTLYLGGPAARHRQDRHRRQRAPQGGQALRRGIRAHQAARRASATTFSTIWRSWRTCCPSCCTITNRGTAAAIRTNSARSRFPLPARIVAVADAFDAMSSDRPYRKGMPDEKVDEILRAGAGQQWDPQVVDAFFRVRDDIRRISMAERQPVQLNTPALV